MADLRTRPLGATATLGRRGYPQIRSATGGTIDIVTGASEPGFNPLDLLLASLAACMSMSARIAARDLGLAERMSGLRVEATGEKADEGPSRFAALTVVFQFEGSLTAKEQLEVGHRAEEICTVSNTLAVRPQIMIDSSRPQPDQG
ncbi:osmotically inducible protein OsmC [Rhizobium sp. Root274]|uniref:OsmC family protein n=1 Tax=unclassified Rhizobium TaxID=2613769 RepID=UPI0007141E7C|nr:MULTISPECIES: OsmC family protein [unclassified Rhizobium]KQW27173.1 osmotically inducible protein OsmC [Rhizobium sp. Root1240]KRD26649.1 osmotically inducible protein OsmC [Rhizobium sp. Root274]